MKTELYIGKVKLNDTDKPKKWLIAINDNGVLLIDNGLFVISFFAKDDVKILESKYIKTIDL